MNSRDVKFLIWLALAIVLMFGVARSCHGQTICVEPIIPGTTLAERQPVKTQVENWVREKGFQTGCPAAWELVVEPLAGRVYSDQIYFVASTSSSPGVVLGTVSVEQPSARFHSWIVGIHPSGQVLMGKQTLGYSLRGGVRKMLRIVSRDGGK